MSTATSERPVQTKHRDDGLDAVIEQTQRRSVASEAAKVLGVEPRHLFQLLRQVWTVSKGQDPLSDAEMFCGVSMIARFGLDPVAREVYVTRGNDGRLMTIVSIDGWIKILDRTPHYDGFEQQLGFTEHGKQKQLEWVETRIYSKERSHPAVYRAYWTEYERLAGFMAKKIGWHMLRLFSLRHAARLFCPLGGNVVSEEEARSMLAGGEELVSQPSKSAKVAEEIAKRKAPEQAGEPEAREEAGPSNEELRQRTEELRQETEQPEVRGEKASIKAAIEQCTTTAQLVAIGQEWHQKLSPKDREWLHQEIESWEKEILWRERADSEAAEEKPKGGKRKGKQW